jgi:hypothetical protein
MVLFTAVALLNLTVATKLPITLLCYEEGIEFKNYSCSKKSDMKSKAVL